VNYHPAMAPGPSLSSTYTQFFPPKPDFTEKDVPDLTGKVYLVTGANTGIGKELARVLYSKNARVYFAARSEEKAKNAIQDIRHGSSPAKSSGELVFLPLDLSDLNKVKEARGPSSPGRGGSTSSSTTPASCRGRRSRRPRRPRATSSASA
jgi:hypothetical protein